MIGYMYYFFNNELIRVKIIPCALPKVAVLSCFWIRLAPYRFSSLFKMPEGSI